MVAGKGEGEKESRERGKGPFPFPPPLCAIVAKNSLLFFVRFPAQQELSASTGGMSARKFRRR